MMLLWLSIAIVALLVELASLGFILLFVAVAALAAAVLAQIGVSLPIQIVSFAAASLALPMWLRRRVLERISGGGVPSRTDALIGTEAEVTQALDPVLRTGRVVAGGQDWAARSDAPIPAGARVVVTDADGITLLVDPLPPR